MKRRYRVLRFVIRLIKGMAIVTAAFGTAAWIITGGIIRAISLFIPSPEVRQAVDAAVSFLAIGQIIAIWLAAVVQWGLAELLEAIADMSESSRATAVLLRRLVEEQRPGATRAQTANGMWDEDQPAGSLWRPKGKMSKEYGGVARWEASDLGEIRLRRGMTKRSQVPTHDVGPSREFRLRRRPGQSDPPAW